MRTTRDTDASKKVQSLVKALIHLDKRVTAKVLLTDAIFPKVFYPSKSVLSMV